MLLLVLLAMLLPRLLYAHVPPLEHCSVLPAHGSTPAVTETNREGAANTATTTRALAEG